MTLMRISDMHHDHEAWRAESALWHDQLREWQADVGRAVTELARVAQLLEEHERKLEVHAAAVRLKECACDRHEHQLAAGAQNREQVCTGDKHCREAADHNAERQRHERLKKAHHTLMARWSLLLRSLQDTDY